MEGGGFFQPVLHRVGYTAAHGAPGVNLVDARVIQLPQGCKQTGRQGGGIGFFAVGQGVTALVQG